MVGVLIPAPSDPIDMFLATAFSAAVSAVTFGIVLFEKKLYGAYVKLVDVCGPRFLIVLVNVAVKAVLADNAVLAASFHVGVMLTHFRLLLPFTPPVLLDGLKATVPQIYLKLFLRTVSGCVVTTLAPLARPLLATLATVSVSPGYTPFTGVGVVVFE